MTAVAAPAAPPALRPGPVWTAAGTTFRLRSTVATGISLCLFDRDDAQREVARLPFARESAGLWRVDVAGLAAGALYGLRVAGPYHPEVGARCNLAKLLVDPWARAVTGEPRWDEALVAGAEREARADPRDSAPWMPRSVVVDPHFDWGDDRPPHTPWESTVLYEAHVRGLTKRHPEVPPELRGTYRGLAHPAVLEHLRSLGVTAVELLPVAQIASEPHLARRDRSNYWGYSPLAPWAPHAGYATAGRGEQVQEFKEMVRALHAADLEVLLDVVWNHSAEGGPGGPSLAWRGLDEALFYRLASGDASAHEDFTGCGNTFDARREEVIADVLDCLRYWVTEMHVDGFRFDLAPTLGRHGGAGEGFSLAAPFFARLAADPLLRAMKLVAEPWDLGPGGYCLGRFPAGWGEWNDRYRDTVRAFWRGDGGKAGDLAARLLGSGDVFAVRAPLASVNFVTAHDGFTLADLTSYESKHNEANGEDNRDGSDHNLARNWGAEGPTELGPVHAARARARRALAATLAFSRGVPMWLAGDELLHTQGGNNNPYCQDNEVTWLDWSGLTDEAGEAAAASREWLAFVRQIFALRRRLAGLRDVAHAGEEVRFLRPDGQPLARADWARHDLRAFGILLGTVPHPLLLLVNGGPEDRLFRLPERDEPGTWTWLLDTGHPDHGHAATPVVAIYAHTLGLLGYLSPD